ncbi:MAG: hypothetical protein WCV85_06050 [Patescibacteria group bacterium]|jgi:hypothetical protein
MSKRDWIIGGLFFLATLVMFAIWKDKMLEVDDEQTRAAQVDYSIPILELLAQHGYDYSTSEKRIVAIDDRSDTAFTFVPVTFYCFSDTGLTPDTILQFFTAEGMEPATLREACIALGTNSLVSGDFCVIALGTKMKDDRFVNDDYSTFRFARLTYCLGVKGAQMALDNPMLPDAINYYAAKPRAKQT